MNEKRIGIIMNGVTGRMGLNQHLVRSILAIRNQGGVALTDGIAADARPNFGGPQRGEAGADCARNMASRAGQRICAVRWRIQMMRFTSTRS